MDAGMQMCTDTDFTIACYCSTCGTDVPMQKEQNYKWICLKYIPSRIGLTLWLYIQGEWQKLNHQWMESLGSTMNLAGGKSKLWICPRCSGCIIRDVNREHRYESDIPHDSLLLQELSVAISTAKKHWNVWDHQRNWNYATSTPKKLRLI